MSIRPNRNAARKKRQQRIRNKVFGTKERPRLNVFRSLKHIYAQVIDDEAGHTLLAVSTLDPEVNEKCGGKGNDVEAAKVVGEVLAVRLKEKGIEQVVFDRGGYRYHGRVKSLAEGAREGGLMF